MSCCFVSRDIEEDFGGPFQFAPIKPPAQAAKPTSGPSAAVKPVPQQPGLSRKDSPHKSPISQPSQVSAKPPQPQSAKAEPPKTLPKPSAGVKATKTTPAPGKDGNSQSLSSQKPDPNKQKVKDYSSESGERQMPTKSAPQSRVLTRPEERNHQSQQSSTSAGCIGVSPKPGQVFKSDTTTQDKVSSEKPPSSGGPLATKADTKKASTKAVEQRGEPKQSFQSPKPTSQAQPFSKSGDYVNVQKLITDQQSVQKHAQGDVYGGLPTSRKAEDKGGTGNPPQTSTSDSKQAPSFYQHQKEIHASKPLQDPHHADQRKQEVVKQQQGDDKHQLHSQRAIKPLSIEQQSQGNRKTSPVQPKLRENQPAKDNRPLARNAKAKSPKTQLKKPDLEEGAMCPLCTSNELNSHTSSLCNVCETNICLNCGAFETSPRTKVSLRQFTIFILNTSSNIAIPQSLQ